jgi:hypothetical protein
MKERDSSGRECNEYERNVWASTERSQNHGHALQKRQDSVLTNQCLGKRMLSGVLRNPDGQEVRNSSKIFVCLKRSASERA